MRENARNVTVIGDGGWGTALALLLDYNGHRVRVWGAFPDYVREVAESRENRAFLPGVDLPERIQFVSDPEEAASDADIIVLAVPSEFYTEVLQRFKTIVPSRALLVSVTKGLDRATHRRMSGIAESLLDHAPVAALSGPSFADEVARGIPTAVVIACSDMERARTLQNVFSNERFRAYTSADVVGTEIGGALKNVIAIAAGVCDGIGLGYNSKAALITRGLAEIQRLGCALGAAPATFSGLSGMGDLLLTCTGKLSRNRSVGERLGKGETLEEIKRSMDQIAEGVWNCVNARALAQDKNVEVPITDEVYGIVHNGKNPRDAVQSLLARNLKAES